MSSVEKLFAKTEKSRSIANDVSNNAYSVDVKFKRASKGKMLIRGHRVR